MCASCEVRIRLTRRLRGSDGIYRFIQYLVLFLTSLRLTSAFNGGESNEVFSTFSHCSKSCSCYGSVVNCSRKRLTRIPGDVLYWAEIVNLNLSHNSIANVDHASLNGLPFLRTLDFSHNKLKRIDSDLFANYSQSSQLLEELKLNHNLLNHFPTVNNLSSLDSLILHHNNISSLVNCSTAVYINLENLDLNFNRLTNIPSNFLNSSKLVTLHMTNNRISSIEKGAFDNVTSLEVLKLAKNRLTSLPKGLFRKLSKLRELDLSRNRLRQIEGLTFLGLEKLQNLKIKRNELTILLDGAFYELSNLQALHLDHNNLTKIRKGWLYGLSNLKQLQLSYNNISEIDGDGWDFCRRLWELELSHNYIEVVKKDTFSRLHSLQYLLLNHNLISFIEDGSFKLLSSLGVLELNHNRISWLLEDTNGPFAGLDKLEHLGISHNQIKSISNSAFLGLPRLQTLDLKENPITSVEKDAFASFKHLHELRFNSTQLICDCNIKSFASWLRGSLNNQKAAMKHQVNEAVCRHPQWLAQMSLVNVNLDDLTCDDFPKPYVTEDPKTQMALKGSNTSLICKAASSSSQMSFEWRKDNVVINTEGSKNFVETFAHTTNDTISEYSSVFQIVDADDEDEGKYQCIISNQFGTAYSQKAQITVNVLPIFSKIPIDVTVKVGKTARLECAAKGHPAPEIAWQKDGGDDFPAARERRMHVMPSDDVFFIVEAKPSDTGVYSCKAQNDAGIVIVNATLTVLETPSFVKKMKDKEAKVGETAVLECKAVGSPKPSVSWKKDDKEMTFSERHFLTLENQLLIIGEVQLSDDGKYSCEMNNVVGSARDSAYLRVVENTDPITEKINQTFWCWIFSNHQTLGITVIVVVVVIVITSLCWVIIIYKTRKRGDEF